MNRQEDTTCPLDKAGSSEYTSEHTEHFYLRKNSGVPMIFPTTGLTSICSSYSFTDHRPPIEISLERKKKDMETLSSNTFQLL